MKELIMMPILAVKEFDLVDWSFIGVATLTNGLVGFISLFTLALTWKLVSSFLYVWIDDWRKRNEH